MQLLEQEEIVALGVYLPAALRGRQNLVKGAAVIGEVAEAPLTTLCMVRRGSNCFSASAKCLRMEGTPSQRSPEVGRNTGVGA